jgi:propanol-preferring alcohol dehydrogenase
MRSDGRRFSVSEIRARAWVVESPRPVEADPLVAREIRVPEPGPGEVRLEVIACGVCRTDVHLAEGDLPPRVDPFVPGHQIVGRVEAVGAGAPSDGPAPGDVVGVTWLAGSCGECRACREGRENLCPDATFTGWDRPGGFAERTIARADVVAPIPAGLAPTDAAPLLCAGVIGWRALRLAELPEGGRLGLVGFGASARLVLQMARRHGAEIAVFTRGESHRRAARAMGATRAEGLDDGAPAECDSIVTFAPTGAVLPGALRHLRPGGTLAINAVHLDGIPAFPYERLFGERTLRSVSHVTRADAREFLAAAAEGDIRTEVTVYPFDRANDALRDVKHSRLDGQAVLEMAAS